MFWGFDVRQCFAISYLYVGVSNVKYGVLLTGYEDVLLDNLRPAKPLVSNVLYRVKTPHQRVIALHVAEQCNIVTSRPQKHLTPSINESRSLLAPEDARMRVFVTDVDGARMTHRQVSRHVSMMSDISDIAPPCREQDEHNRNRKREIIDMNKDKQIRLTCRFQKAMDILDSIKISKGLPVTSQKDSRRVRNPLKVYNTWSQGWSREFKFQYG